jgi:hypothetical protein
MLSPFRRTLFLPGAEEQQTKGAKKEHIHSVITTKL